MAQVVASNVDVVLVVCPVSHFNANRMERLLLAVCACEAEPVLVLSKGDLLPPQQCHTLVLESKALMQGLRVLCTSSAGNSPEWVRAEFEALLQVDLAQLPDGRGTPGHRRCSRRGWQGSPRYFLPPTVRSGGGALVMDTPGMREFALWSDAGGLERVFADVTQLVQQCQFSNCTHKSDPGCAVQAALKSKALTLRRFVNWSALQSEMEGNVDRRSLMEGRRQRVDWKRKKKRDERFSDR